MADYDLSRLSARSFEQLVQALAVKIIAPGVTIFGDGPDGGREATFQGRMNFPAEQDYWSGYLVVQAKFLQRLRNTQHDQQWALRELRKELKRFANSAKRRLRPEYYIFATNVVLTPAGRVGGKDQVAEAFSRFKKLAIRGWRVWDYDQIRTYLDGEESVRHAYEAFITPGDVLAQVMKWFRATRHNFHSAMTSLLAKDLIGNQFAKLEGHATEDKIPLARVFVDLPIAGERVPEPPPEEHGIKPKGWAPGFATRVVTGANVRLDARSTYQDAVPGFGLPDAPRGDGLLPGRFVLIGGPGQGKSTVAQYICQLFRTSLLVDRRKSLLPANVRQCIEAINRQCADQGIELPTARRFPIFVVLNDFAVALQTKESTSLLSYIAGEIRRKTDEQISVQDVREWLESYPWVLVLDGLDEVPASANRDDVMKKVDEFWIDAALCNADILVIATTRPQGYNDEFSPGHYEHLWLAPLSKKRAMEYATRLVNVRYDEEEQKRRILSRLQKASNHEATARLMQSPLQVTIMTTLLDQIGEPPQDRWRLFHEYYRTIYRREMERPTIVAPLLRERQGDIDTIHNRVALLLQMESERSGGTEARLSTDRFAAVVQARLQEEGHTGEILKRLRDQIIEASANRLVFLVGLQSGQVGFEIRSLQEFMAAEALMQGSDNVVHKRLQSIAPLSSWRNVFLFAAGRCFAEAQHQHLRHTILGICSDLNSQLIGPIGHRTLAGSELAIDLLADGVAFHQPLFARSLGDCALRMLDLPPDRIHSRLAEQCDSNLEPLFREEIVRRLRSGTMSDRLPAWEALLHLSSRGLGWARQLVKANWPDGSEEQYAILDAREPRRADEWLAEAYKALAPRIDARRAARLGWRLIRDSERSTTRPFWDDSYIQRRSISVPLFAGTAVRSLTVLSLSGLKPGWPAVADGSRVHPSWLLLQLGLEFSSQPGKHQLADALRKSAKGPFFATLRDVQFGFGGNIDKWLIARLPWPLAACLAAAGELEGVTVLAERADAGLLGDVEDWRAAEQRWREPGITLDDFEYATEEQWPFNSQISKIGFPFAAAELMLERPSKEPVRFLWDLYARAAHRRSLRAEIGLWLLEALFWSAKPEIPMSPEDLIAVVEPFGRAVLSLGFLTSLLSDPGQETRWLDCLDRIGRERRYQIAIGHIPRADLGPLAKLLKLHPDKIGLLRLLVEGLRVPMPRRSEIDNLDFDPGSIEDVHLRGSAIALRLVQSRFSIEEAEPLAEMTIGLLRNGVTDVIGTVEGAVLGTEFVSQATEAYFLKLLEKLDINEWRAKASAITILNVSLRRRRSGLHEYATYTGLELPQGLYGLN